jgi:hypothetical protein
MIKSLNQKILMGMTDFGKNIKIKFSIYKLTFDSCL